MICRHCGKAIPESSVFCPFCGKKLESHLRAEDAYAERDAAIARSERTRTERALEEEREAAEPERRPKRKRRGKALITILAAFVFVILAFIIIMVVAKPFLGEEPWDASKEQTEQAEEETAENSGPIKNMYVASKEGLIMRKDQDQNSDAVHILNYGQEVEVQKINESWAYVTADGITGWVSTDYLTDEKIETESNERTPASEEDRGKLVEPSTRIKSGYHGVVNADGGLNLRCGPGKDYNILLVVPDKTEVVEEGREGDWIFIKYSGEYGWVNTEYITPVQADQNTGS